MIIYMYCTDRIQFQVIECYSCEAKMARMCSRQAAKITTQLRPPQMAKTDKFLVNFIVINVVHKNLQPRNQRSTWHQVCQSSCSPGGGHRRSIMGAGTHFGTPGAHATCARNLYHRSCISLGLKESNYFFCLVPFADHDLVGGATSSWIGVSLLQCQAKFIVYAFPLYSN